ncbi:Ig mu chain C region membrane-bound form, partial [Nibea albiflora]
LFLLFLATSTKPTVFPLTQCGSGPGDTVTLACYATGFTPSSLTYAWTTEGTSLSNSIQYPPVQKGSHYTGISQIQVSKQDWDARKAFQCAVTHAAGNAVCFFAPIIEFLIETNYLWNNTMDTEDDSMGDTALTFILLFLITLLFSIGTTVVKANSVDISDKLYVDLPEAPGLHSISRRFTVPPSHWKKDRSFTCKVNQGFSSNFESNSTGNIFVDPSVELLLVPSEESGPQRLLCSGWGFNPQITWFTESQQRSSSMDDISMGADGRVSVTSQLQIPQTEWKTGKGFTCEVSDRSLRKSVKKDTNFCSATPTGPTAFDLRECDSGTGDTISLACYTTGFTPSSLTYDWTKNGNEFTPSIDYPPVQNGSLYSGISQIQVSKQDWDARKVFHCMVKHPAGNAFCHFPNPEPLYQLPTLSVLGSSSDDEKKEASFSCFAKDFSPKDHKLTWLKDDQDITNKKYEITTPVQERTDDRGTTLYNAASFLTVPSNGLSQGTRFTCLFEGKGQTQRPSVFMMPPVEHTRKEMVTLTCFVKDFFPQEVYVSWLVDDEEVDSTYEFHTTNPVESYGSYSAYSQYYSPLEQWKRNDVVYSCVVHHESVANTTKAIVRSIGYRTHEKNTNLVNLNMNVPDTCKPQ